MDEVNTTTYIFVSLVSFGIVVKLLDSFSEEKFLHKTKHKIIMKTSYIQIQLSKYCI